MRDRGCGLITLAAQVVRLFRQPANQGSRWGSARPRVLFDKVVRVLAARRWVVVCRRARSINGDQWRLGPGRDRVLLTGTAGPRHPQRAAREGLVSSCARSEPGCCGLRNRPVRLGVCVRDRACSQCSRCHLRILCVRRTVFTGGGWRHRLAPGSGWLVVPEIECRSGVCPRIPLGCMLALN